MGWPNILRTELARRAKGDETAEDLGVLSLTAHRLDFLVHHRRTNRLSGLRRVAASLSALVAQLYASALSVVRQMPCADSAVAAVSFCGAMAGGEIAAQASTHRRVCKRHSEPVSFYAAPRTGASQPAAASAT